ncbi:MAG: thiolase domain-containing protein [Candidatus Bathyarchaeota archaeon]|nr:thiolase domain-containing protein [Candidatus Bathyarchaeota archaeon]
MIALSLHRKVSVIGAGMTRFHHKLHLEKQGRELFTEAALEAAESVDNGFTLKEADALYLGYFSSDMFEGQAHISALMADWIGINPKPAVRVEGACASSGMAVNMGVLAIASGLYDVVVVGGVEKMRTLDTSKVTDTLAMAADVSYEVAMGFTFPGLYAAIASAYFNKYGSTWEQLANISIKNHENGALNKKAHYQETIMDIAKKLGERKQMSFSDEMEFLNSALNPMVASPLRLFDCCPISDGAAAVILAADDVAKKYTDTPVKIVGIGQASDTMALHDREDITALMASRVASRNAYDMAGIKAKDVSVACVHDCFTIAEIVATEDLGFFPKGQGGKAAMEGRTGLDGDVAVNADGGLKAKGHPVGATGAAMVYDIFKQLRGEAGDHQVADAEVGIAHNVGAAGATVTMQVYRR